MNVDGDTNQGSALYGPPNSGWTRSNPPGCISGRDASDNGVINTSPSARTYNCGSRGEGLSYYATSSNPNMPFSKTLTFQIIVDPNAPSNAKFCARFHVGKKTPGISVEDIIQGQLDSPGSSSLYQAVYAISDVFCYAVEPRPEHPPNILPEGDISAAACRSMTLRAYDRNSSTSARRAARFYVSVNNSAGGATPIYGSRSSPIGLDNANVDYRAHDIDLRSYIGGSGSNPIFNLWVQDRDTDGWIRADIYQPARIDCSSNPPPSFDVYADCNIVRIENLQDPNMSSGGVHYFGAIYQRHADGVQGPEAGTINGYGSGSFNIDYSAREDGENAGWIIRIGLHDVLSDGNREGPWGYDFTEIKIERPCYTAHCTSLTVNTPPGWPANAVKENELFTVTARFHNDQSASTTDYLPNSLSDGSRSFDLAGNLGFNGATEIRRVGRDVPAQQDFEVTYQFRAPSGIRDNIPISAKADYYGLFAIDSSPCNETIRTYQEFKLTPYATVDMKPSEQNPTNVDYHSYVVHNFGPAAFASTTSRFYKRTVAGVDQAPIATGPANSGTYSVGSTTEIIPQSNYAPNPFPPFEAGDKYCTYITIGNTRGWRGPRGTTDVIGRYTPAGEDPVRNQCDTVHNKPFFKAYNGSLSAGGEFKAKSGSCTGGGTLGSWNNSNNDFGGVNSGAGTQLAAIAVVKIVGFASAQTVITRSPTDLTFANSNAADISRGAESPSLGGNFGGEYCLNDVSPPTGTSTPIASGSGVPAASGSYSASGNFAFNGGSLGPGKKVSIFVDGNVYIGNNITYSGGWNADNVPFFSIKATGNIYLAGNVAGQPGVTQLDGLYTAQNNIYTCSNGFAYMPANRLYAECKNQLLVNGSFVADNVKLMRTFGSLRDEKVVTPPPAPGGGGATQPLVWSCGSANSSSPCWSGRVAGMACESINERIVPASATWGDNHLCVQGADAGTIKLDWTDRRSTEPPNLALTPHCTVDWGSIVNSLQFRHSYSWADDYLCSNVPVAFKTTDTTSATEYCTQLIEPSDNYGIRKIWQPLPIGSAYVCIRRAAPSPPPVPALQLSDPCSNAGIRMAVNTCAAEVFRFSPELYLWKDPTGGVLRPPNNGAPTYDAITSLPPVL